jgi:hypothetical protein
MAPPLPGQINVNVRTMPGLWSCHFTLVRLTDGARSNTLSIVPTGTSSAPSPRRERSNAPE